MSGDCCLSLFIIVISLIGHQNGIWVLRCSFLSLLCLLKIKMPLREVHETLGNAKTLFINYTFANYIFTYLKNTPGRGYGCLASVQLQNQVLASTCFWTKAMRCHSMFCSFFCSKLSRSPSMSVVFSGGGVEMRQQKSLPARTMCASLCSSKTSKTFCYTSSQKEIRRDLCLLSSSAQNLHPNSGCFLCLAGDDRRCDKKLSTRLLRVCLFVSQLQKSSCTLAIFLAENNWTAKHVLFLPLLETQPPLIHMLFLLLLKNSCSPARDCCVSLDQKRGCFSEGYMLRVFCVQLSKSDASLTMFRVTIRKKWVWCLSSVFCTNWRRWQQCLFFFS